jgi:hypothetical protein
MPTLDSSGVKQAVQLGRWRVAELLPWKVLVRSTGLPPPVNWNAPVLGISVSSRLVGREESNPQSFRGGFTARHHQPVFETVPAD